MGAFWKHDGNPKRPHPLISSKKHSDSYTNSELVLEDPTVLNMACLDLVKTLRLEGLELDEVDRVIGPEKGAVRISHDVARKITSTRRILKHCLSAYAEKKEEGEHKRMVLSRFAIHAGERLLPVEDVLTTGGSVRLTVLAAESAGATILPFVGGLVNSSGQSELDGMKIVELIKRPISVWTPQNCPFCRLGSEPIRPKSVENWARLNASY